MPNFPDRETILTREEAVNSIMTSIAMEEAALSHIINAEGEKIQFAIKRCNADVASVVRVNESVSCLIDRIIDLQVILKNKLRLVKCFLPDEKCGTNSYTKPFSGNQGRG